MKYILITLILLAQSSWATTTRVGNGDNGSDLEGFELITSGPIVKAQKDAVKLLKELNVRSIYALGQLIYEVERSQLYMTKKDVTDMELKELGGFETDMRGYIYARTFAKPHAATRFFPVSLTLNNDQLIALHIHEGLHRALPEHVREDEKAVTAITLAITNPEASFDTISEVTKAQVPDLESERFLAKQYYLGEDLIKRNHLAYSTIVFNYKGSEKTKSSPTHMHKLSSKLYPFGGSMEGVGLGLKMSYLKQENGDSALGPLGVSLEGKFLTKTRFKLLWFLEQNIASSANEQWQNSYFGRDTTTAGLKMYSIKTSRISLSNSLKYTLASESTDTTFSEDIVYQYGPTIAANIDIKANWKNFGFGGNLEYSIAGQRTVTQGNFENIDPREKIVTLEPEVAYIHNNFSVTLFSKFLLNSEEDSDLGRFSDLFNYGAGEQNIGLKINYLW